MYANKSPNDSFYVRVWTVGIHIALPEREGTGVTLDTFFKINAHTNMQRRDTLEKKTQVVAAYGSSTMEVDLFSSL